MNVTSFGLHSFNLMNMSTVPDSFQSVHMSLPSSGSLKVNDINRPVSRGNDLISHTQASLPVVISRMM